MPSCKYLLVKVSLLCTNRRVLRLKHYINLAWVCSGIGMWRRFQLCGGMTELYPKYKSRQSSNFVLRAFSVTLALIISPGRYVSLMDWKPKETLLLEVCCSAFFICLSLCTHVCAQFLKKPLWSSLNCSHKQATGRCEPLLAEERWWRPLSGIHNQTCSLLAVASSQCSCGHISWDLRKTCDWSITKEQLDYLRQILVHKRDYFFS